MPERVEKEEVMMCNAEKVIVGMVKVQVGGRRIDEKQPLTSVCPSTLP